MGGRRRRLETPEEAEVCLVFTDKVQRYLTTFFRGLSERIFGRVIKMPAMEKHLFNLKFAAKELQRNAKKCDKEEKIEKAKVKKAIQKGNTEVARIHAENAIRQKNQSVNFLRMSARVDAVAARVQTAVTMNQVTKSMAGVVKGMDATLN